MTLGELMKEKRNTLNMTRQDMSNLMNVSVNSVINWESDGHPPNPDKFGVIMNAYQIDRDDFGKAYMDTVCPKEPDFPDDFPTEYFSDAALKLLPQLKFSAEEVELWRMLRLYTDFEWYFSDDWERTYDDDAKKRYVTAMELAEHLPANYVEKIGIDDILNMIYNIESKLPNIYVEERLWSLFCPSITPYSVSEYRKIVSEKGFDITTLNANFLKASGLVDVNYSEYYHNRVSQKTDSFLATTLNRLSEPLRLALKNFSDTTKGYSKVFEKNLHKTYNGYEYIDEGWMHLLFNHTEYCIGEEIPKDKYSDLEYFAGFDMKNGFIIFDEPYENLEDDEDIEEMKITVNNIEVEDEEATITDHAVYERELDKEEIYINKVLDVLHKTAFWNHAVENNETEEITGINTCDDWKTWHNIIEPVPSPFYDWVEFHYEKTDDKLICTASLTKKGIQLAVDEYGWEQCINENTLRCIDAPDNRFIPTQTYNNILDVVSKYIDDYDNIVTQWNADPDCCDFAENFEMEKWQPVTAEYITEYERIFNMQTTDTNHCICDKKFETETSQLSNKEIMQKELTKHLEKWKILKQKPKDNEVTAKDLKNLIELGIWWKTMNQFFDEMMGYIYWSQYRPTD